MNLVLKTFVIMILLFPASVFCSVPGQVNFQGVLFDNANQVVNGSANFNFSLFDSATGGTQLWSESQTGVPVNAGIYSVALGAVSPLTTSIISGDAVYLEISVGGEILTPRQRLLAVPYALKAEEAEAVSGVSGVFIQQLFLNANFDGQSLSNNDPLEGLIDTDGDGRANFIDPDNDGDGILDDQEVANGTGVNLVTPKMSAINPSTVYAGYPTLVTITGSGFLPGLTVQVGTENPIPQNLTSTSFDITIGAGQTTGSATLTVTNPNAEIATSSVQFTLITPVISTINPSNVFAGLPTLVTITGTGFLPGLTVQVGTENPIPQNLTSTSFDITVGSGQILGTFTVTVTNPNAELATDEITFYGKLAFVTSGTVADAMHQTVATADAFCMQAATSAGLPGSYVSWYSDPSNNISAKDRFPVAGGPWMRIDGVLVATDLTDLTDGSINVPISLYENGVEVQSTVLVATNTSPLGLVDLNSCSGATPDSGFVGKTNVTGDYWTSLNYFGACTASRPYYCFEE